MDDREAYIALNMMEKIGPVTVRRLLEVLGAPAEIFTTAPGLLRKAQGIGPALADHIAVQRERLDWQAEIDRAEKLGVRLVTPLDDEYPAALKGIYDPPLALYVRGRLLDRDRHGVAVVGTRRPTHYGRDVTARMAFGLAKAGLTVTSGLALGVDTVAHDSALKAHGRTVAVLGSGMDCLYPQDNRELADRITEAGAVISELPLGRQPDRTTFPMRNRIVSGMSMGVLVIEADRRSGACITAREALEQGRIVFAVPGRIDSPASRGTNALIKDGAKLTASVDDVLEEFEYLIPPVRPGSPVRTASTVEINEDEQRVVDAIRSGCDRLDGIIRQTGLGAARVSSLMVALEMKRIVKMIPGGRVALRRADPGGEWIRDDCCGDVGEADQGKPEDHG